MKKITLVAILIAFGLFFANNVQANNLPYNFAVPNVVYVNQMVSFQAPEFTQYNNIVNYAWVFSENGKDITTIYGQAIGYRFSHPGIHSVKLVVKDVSEHSIEIARTINVRARIIADNTVPINTIAPPTPNTNNTFNEWDSNNTHNYNGNNNTNSNNLNISLLPNLSLNLSKINVNINWSNITLAVVIASTIVLLTTMIALAR